MSVAVGRNPIFAKDLRGRIRGRQLAGALLLYLLAFALLDVVFLVTHQGLSIADGPSAGSSLFRAGALGQLLLLVAFVPLTTARVVSAERRLGTWDLLRATPLSAASLAGGKLLAVITFHLLLLIAAAPFFLPGILLGGIPPAGVLRVATVELTTLLLLAAGGVFISWYGRRELLLGGLFALLVGVTALAALLAALGSAGIWLAYCLGGVLLTAGFFLVTIRFVRRTAE